jgi:diguanylate cyclase (GGDEF)-like protein/PAS domain S-box-containing protein
MGKGVDVGIREAASDVALHACVLGAAARLHLSLKLWLRAHGRVREHVLLGTSLGAASVLAHTMMGTWRDASAGVVPWSGVFVLLAFLLGGLQASLSSASIVLGAAVVLGHSGVLVLSTWSSQLLVAISLGALGRVLLVRARSSSRYLVIAVLGAAAALLPALLSGANEISRLEARTWSMYALGTALALCLGHRAFAGLSAQPGAPPDAPPERSMQQAFAQHALILENAVEGIALLDADGNVTQINPALASLVGRPHDTLMGTPWLELVPATERAALNEALHDSLRVGRAVVECVLINNEVTLPVEFTLVRDAPAPGRVATVHLLARDLRERRATAWFEHLALHDQLTGLPNRRALLDRLEDALKSSPGRQTKVALLLFDIDDFKHINDTLGHAAGDAVLKHVAAQMSRALRSTDTLGRLGGDEFVLIARGIDSSGRAAALARRFCEQAARPLQLDHVNLAVQLSVGIAIADARFNSPDRLLERADHAMYAAKRTAHANSGVGKRLQHASALFAKDGGKA